MPSGAGVSITAKNKIYYAVSGFVFIECKKVQE